MIIFINFLLLNYKDFKSLQQKPTFLKHYQDLVEIHNQYQNSFKNIFYINIIINFFDKM